MKKCAILTMDCLDDFEAYDHLIGPPLNVLGWQVEMVSWRKAQVDWNAFNAVIIRSPWDYQEDATKFLQVLTNIENSTAQLENSLAIVQWNIDKLYLKELEQAGVTIVPTIWHEKLVGQALEQHFLTDCCNHLGQQQLVLKPRISANADNTFWLNSKTIQQNLPEMSEAFAQRDFMIQPFMDSIIEEGEYSLFYFNGRYSHTILKTPKANDFRVQEEHGGCLKTVEPETTLLEHAKLAMQAINNIHETPLYARVDFVRYEKGFALMEAELIEPSLYFNMDNQSPKRFAQAFNERMKNLPRTLSKHEH
jgi:hypothetical protein